MLGAPELDAEGLLQMLLFPCSNCKLKHTISDNSLLLSSAPALGTLKQFPYVRNRYASWCYQVICVSAAGSPWTEFHGEFYSLFQYYLGCDSWLSFLSYPSSVFDLLRSSASHVPYDFWWCSSRISQYFNTNIFQQILGCLYWLRI